MKATRTIAAGIFALMTMPAHAAAVQVPEPGTISLVALGLFGMAIGIRVWRKK